MGRYAWPTLLFFFIRYQSTMPYKRHYKRKRPTKGKSIAKKALSRANKAVRLAKRSSSWIVGSFASQVTSQGGTLYEPCLMTQGTGQGDRVGDRITLMSILFRGLVQWNSGGISHQEVRIMCVLDKQANGSTFTTTELLESSNASLRCYAPRNPDGYDRFSVLYDKCFQVDTYHPVKLFKKHLRLRNLDILYEANSGTITDLTSKNLVIAVWTNSGSAQPTLDLVDKVTYLV